MARTPRRRQTVVADPPPPGAVSQDEPASTPTLASLLALGPVGPVRARRIGEAIARALATRHARGEVVGNLGPDKILVELCGDRENVKLVEPPPAGSRLPSEVVLTPTHMAPEQVQAAAATPASDLYALGVVLFQMFAGGLPFGGRSDAEILVAKTLRDAPSLAVVSPAATPADSLLVDACLARDPTQRPASALDVAERLGEAGRARATIVLPTRPRSRIRGDLVALLAAFAVAIAAVAFAFAEDDPASPWRDRVGENLLAP